MNMKTPLRYPGGKSKALKSITPYLPDMSKVKEYREPFLGGGSMAFYMSKNYPHLEVWVNDLYEPLYNFWNMLQLYPEYIANTLFDLRDVYDTPEKAKILYWEGREFLHDKTIEDRDRAVFFFVVNKLSFSGLTEASSFSPKALTNNFTFKNIGKLPAYSLLMKNWRITNKSYEELFTDDREVLLYLDPPYSITSDNLYGKGGSLHKEFDHEEFINTTDRYSCKQLISYNTDMGTHPQFYGWGAATYDHSYSMLSDSNYRELQKEKRELLLYNY